MPPNAAAAPAMQVKVTPAMTEDASAVKALNSYTSGKGANLFDLNLQANSDTARDLLVPAQVWIGGFQDSFSPGRPFRLLSPNGGIFIISVLGQRRNSPALAKDLSGSMGWVRMGSPAGHPGGGSAMASGSPSLRHPSP